MRIVIRYALERVDAKILVRRNSRPVCIGKSLRPRSFPGARQARDEVLRMTKLDIAAANRLGLAASVHESDDVVEVHASEHVEERAS